jgi:hypothetical protein
VTVTISLVMRITHGEGLMTEPDWNKIDRNTYKWGLCVVAFSLTYLLAHLISAFIGGY